MEQGIARIVAAASNPAAIEPLLVPGVTHGGVWFPDAECRKQFARVGPIEQPRLGAFAKCLATLGWKESERTTRFPDTFLLTYDPGLELEVMLSREDEPRILWIGYVSRVLATDNAPTVTQAALEARRVDPQSIPGEHTLWVKLCIDETGVVTSARPDLVSAPEAQEPLLGHVKQWRFTPFELDGVAAPVCAAMRVGATIAGYERVPPVFAGADMQGITVDAATLGKRIAGTPFVVPDDEDKMAIARSNQGAVMAAIRFCLDATGQVVEARISRTSGVPGYDAKLLAGVKGWRYEPRASTRLCAHVEFIYNQRR